MKRDSMIFYRSFYEAIIGLPRDIQSEVFIAVLEYGLNENLTDDLKPVAKGMFALMKPVIDKNNARFQNGQKGGRKPAARNRQGDKPSTARNKHPKPAYTLTFAQEVEQMCADPDWIASICQDFAISPDECAERLRRFLKHCADTRPDKPHESYEDAKTHLRYWIDKAYPRTSQPPKASAAKAQAAKKPAKKSEPERIDYDKMEREAESPANLIRRMGYDPAVVKISQALNPQWRAENPPTLPPQ